MDLPAQLAKPDLSFVDDKDTIPSNIDNSTISYIGGFLSVPLIFLCINPHTTVKWPDNGEGVSLHTITNYNHFYRESDQEWTAIDTVLVRFDTMYTPSGHFPVYLNTSKSVFSIGYDVVVCVQKYEPWILETYNASIVSPSALRIVEKGDINTSPAPSGNVRGAPINNTRYLRTTGKDFAFTVAHLNSVNQMVKNNGRDIAYLPSSTVSPVVHSLTTFQTSTYSTGCFFHRRHWALGVHRAFPRPARSCPRTGRCSQHFAIPCRVGTCRRTVIPERNASVRHFRAVAADPPPGACPDSGNRWRAVRADVTAQCSTERIRSLQLVSGVSVSGRWI